MRRRMLSLVLLSMPVLAGSAGLIAAGSGSDLASGAWAHAGSLAVSGGALLGRLPALVAHGYLRTPEMIVGLGTALALPFVALASVTVRWIARRRASRARTARLLDGRPQRRDKILALGMKSGPCARVDAWLEIADKAGARDLVIGGELLRIGHDADNDLALPYQGVQPFHALIRRTPETDFVVIDVSGAGGRGVAVNGRRLRSCPLQDGDRIELGGVAVTFHRPGRGRPDQPLASRRLDDAS